MPKTNRPVCCVCNVANTVIPTAPPHYGRYKCPKCGRDDGYAPMPPEKYKDYVMPFGRNMGLSLAKIATRPSGLKYLEWASANLSKPRLRELISAYLDQLKETASA